MRNFFSVCFDACARACIETRLSLVQCWKRASAALSLKAGFVCVCTCAYFVAEQQCRPGEVVKHAKAVAWIEHQRWENVVES